MKTPFIPETADHGFIDIVEPHLGACGLEQVHQGPADTPCALHEDTSIHEGRTCKKALAHNLDACKDPQCRDWPGVSCATGLRGSPKNVRGAGRCNDVHVHRRGAHVGTGKVEAMELIDQAAVTPQEIGPQIGIKCIREMNDRLSSATGETGDGKLVGHCLCKPQHIMKRCFRSRIGLHPRSARSRAQTGRMDGDENPCARGLVMADDDFFSAPVLDERLHHSPLVFPVKPSIAGFLEPSYSFPGKVIFKPIGEKRPQRLSIEAKGHVLVL
jgi:hypothetical protein